MLILPIKMHDFNLSHHWWGSLWFGWCWPVFSTVKLILSLFIMNKYLVRDIILPLTNFKCIHLFLSICFCDFLFYSMFQYVMIIVHFDTQIVPSLASGSSIKLAPVSFSYAPMILWVPPAFWYTIVQAHLVLSLPQPWNHWSLQGALASFSGEWN